jgi:hypothetical protein
VVYAAEDSGGDDDEETELNNDIGEDDATRYVKPSFPNWDDIILEVFAYVYGLAAEGYLTMPNNIYCTINITAQVVYSLILSSYFNCILRFCLDYFIFSSFSQRPENWRAVVRSSEKRLLPAQVSNRDAKWDTKGRYQLCKVICVHA